MLKNLLVLLLVVSSLIGGIFYLYSSQTSDWNKVESDLREMNFSEEEINFFKSSWDNATQEQRKKIKEMIENNKKKLELLQ